MLDEIVREAARQMLAVALQAEVSAYIDAHAEEVDEHGHRLVVRNGHHNEREVITAAGRCRCGRRGSTTSAPIRPLGSGNGSLRRSCRRGRASRRGWPRCCRCCTCTASPSSDFAPALTQFLGTGHGLSAATITRLTKDWQDEATAFNQRSLADTDYVYVWVDGIHLKVRLEQDKVCLLVMIGVRADGTKELIALDDGHRESSESWLDLLRACKRRGMRAPVLAVGDGALGFWSAVREVFPETSEQRCWCHKIANVLNALPKSAQPGAKAALAEIWNAEDKDHAQGRGKAFAAEYGAKWPKAAAKITDDLDVLLAFFDYPAEHWVHLRTTNPIESTFATVRLRQRVTKGPGSSAAGIAMAFKLIEAAQARWRAVNAPHLVALVRAGALFKNGKLVERPDESEGGDQQVA